jgi:hypothetical protein
MEVVALIGQRYYRISLGTYVTEVALTSYIGYKRKSKLSRARHKSKRPNKLPLLKNGSRKTTSVNTFSTSENTGNNNLTIYCTFHNRFTVYQSKCYPTTTSN